VGDRASASTGSFRDAPPEVSLPIGSTVKARVAEGLVTFRVVGYTDEEEHVLRIADVTLIGD
jgi:hypothetical protein